MEEPRKQSWFSRALQFVNVRARFVLVIVVIGLVVGQWERLTGYWNWLTRTALGQADRQSAVSSDTEFYCPMDPGVVSPWEEKCPICNMALVRRKKGDAPLLPEGVVARMQVSPYRLQLAGVKTSPVQYRRLLHELVFRGTIRRDNSTESLIVQATAAADDLRFLQIGQAAVAHLSDSESPRARAKLISIDHNEQSEGATIEFALESAEPPSWRPGVSASVVVASPLDQIEPYRSLSREPPPIQQGVPRVAYVARDNPAIIRTQPGKSPIDNTELLRVALESNQRLDWWCPMHPEVMAQEDGHECAKCNGMKLLPRIVTYAPPGHVLCVPASAVIDTGSRRLVYVEVAPGMLEGRLVDVGTRAGEFYPVLRGLSPSDRVVSAGAFLIDAETRLSGNASTAYFGAATVTKP